MHEDGRPDEPVDPWPALESIPATEPLVPESPPAWSFVGIAPAPVEQVESAETDGPTASVDHSVPVAEPELVPVDEALVPVDEVTQPLFRAAEPQFVPAPVPTADDQPLAPPDNATTLRDRLLIRHRGPVRRFVLYASGADTRVLHYAPVEESDFVVQGSLVILTAIVAAVSGLAASSFLTIGHFALTPITLAIGLIWGLLIFFFDRALVSGTFNPYRFTRGEVESLRDLGVPSPWAHLITVEDDRNAVRRRAGEVVRVALVASLRVALALATSYIAAELVLFLVFQPEVNARTEYLQQQEQSQRIAAIQSDYAAQSAARSDERKQLTGAADPDVLRLTAQTDTLTTQADAARRDLGVLQAAAAAEFDGDKYTGTLSDGTVVTTTGRRGDGAAARSLAQRRDNQQAVVNDLVARRDQSRTARDARLDAIKKDNASALSTLDQRDNTSAADEKAAVAAAVGDPSAVNGLLIRQAALDKLTYDVHPETLTDDPIPACTGPFAWFCGLRNWLIPPTPMGPEIVAFRVIFFVIEILPITYKVIASLRRRRPYDIAKAALEEASRLESIRMLDRHLHDASRDLVTRSDGRRDTRDRATPRPPIDPVQITLPRHRSSADLDGYDRR
jgi:hypothetical protein